MPEQKVIYIKYNQCRQSPLLSIAEFGQAIIDAARANPPSKLVFDLRDNTGGASIWFSQLMNQFYLAYAQGVLQMPEGGVYGIISKRTFSSGTLAAVDLKRAGVILVGETTGGNPTWYGDTVTVTLPNSRLTMSISQKKVIADGFTTPIAPDIPVDFRSEDYFAERDPFLAAILNR
jgi:C-terminal processing protease CtpA/Prc